MDKQLEKIPSLDSKISQLARLLEDNGVEDALSIIEIDIVPLFIKGNSSLLDTVLNYADSDEEQDTGPYQIYEALTKINRSDLDFLL